MKQDLVVELKAGETTDQAMARTVTSPECLSASVLTICQNIDQSQITEMVSELKRQTAAIHADDLSRAESMLIAQAHTLDGLFAKLTTRALTSPDGVASCCKQEPITGSSCPLLKVGGQTSTRLCNFGVAGFLDIRVSMESQRAIAELVKGEVSRINRMGDIAARLIQYFLDRHAKHSPPNSAASEIIAIFQHLYDRLGWYGCSLALHALGA